MPSYLLSAPLSYCGKEYYRNTLIFSELRAWLYKPPGSKECSLALANLTVERVQYIMACPFASACNHPLLLRLPHNAFCLWICINFCIEAEVIETMTNYHGHLSQAPTSSKLAEPCLHQLQQVSQGYLKIRLIWFPDISSLFSYCTHPSPGIPFINRKHSIIELICFSVTVLKHWKAAPELDYSVG